MRVAPPHFEYGPSPGPGWVLDSLMVDWIEKNLRGRYWIGEKTTLANDGTIKIAPMVGFEKPSELSFFLISYTPDKF